jgi:hypothetical protein
LGGLTPWLLNRAAVSVSVTKALFLCVIQLLTLEG